MPKKDDTVRNVLCYYDRVFYQEKHLGTIMMNLFGKNHDEEQANKYKRAPGFV